MNISLKELKQPFPFHQQLLENEKFLEGDFTTKFYG